MNWSSSGSASSSLGWSIMCPERYQAIATYTVYDAAARPTPATNHRPINAMRRLVTMALSLSFRRGNCCGGGVKRSAPMFDPIGDPKELLALHHEMHQPHNRPAEPRRQPEEGVAPSRARPGDQARAIRRRLVEHQRPGREKSAVRSE